QVAISWRSDAPLIDHVTVEPGSSPARVWRYEYLNPGSDDATLAAVVLPDGSRWTFALAGLGGAPMTDLQLARCDTRTLTGTGTPVTSTLTAPSGLVGTFVVTPLWHARSLVPSTCSPDPYTHAPRETIPPVFGNAALTRKTLSGPGMAERTWTYAYAPASGSTTRDACAAAGTCDTTTWVDITDPAGNRTRHTYNTRWGATEGKLLRSEAYAGSAELLRTTSYEYAASTQGPWPALLGDLMLNGLSNEAPRERPGPRSRRARSSSKGSRSPTRSARSTRTRRRPARPTTARWANRGRRSRNTTPPWAPGSWARWRSASSPASLPSRPRSTRSIAPGSATASASWSRPWVTT